MGDSSEQPIDYHEGGEGGIDGTKNDLRASFASNASRTSAGSAQHKPSPFAQTGEDDVAERLSHTGHSKRPKESLTDRTVEEQEDSILAARKQTVILPADPQRSRASTEMSGESPEHQRLAEAEEEFGTAEQHHGDPNERVEDEGVETASPTRGSPKDGFSPEPTRTSAERPGDESGQPKEAAAAAASLEKEVLPSPPVAPAVEVMSEAETEAQWRRHKKHIFIFTSSGKPVFTRYGDENSFSELFGVMQILLSMAESRGDSLRRATIGKHSVTFSTEGDLCYVMVSTTNESPQSCVRQLRLMHNVLLSVIPNVVTVLKKAPGYDVRRMLGDADYSVISSLIHNMNTRASFAIHGVQALRMPASVRGELLRIMEQNQCGESHLYSVVLRGYAVAAVYACPGETMHPADMLVLLNFVDCNDVTLTSRHVGEVWAPICLPV